MVLKEVCVVLFFRAEAEMIHLAQNTECGINRKNFLSRNWIILLFCSDLFSFTF